MHGINVPEEPTPYRGMSYTPSGMDGEDRRSEKKRPDLFPSGPRTSNGLRERHYGITDQVGALTTKTAPTVSQQPVKPRPVLRAALPQKVSGGHPPVSPKASAHKRSNIIQRPHPEKRLPETLAPCARKSRRSAASRPGATKPDVSSSLSFLRPAWRGGWPKLRSLPLLLLGGSPVSSSSDPAVRADGNARRGAGGTSDNDWPLLAIAPPRIRPDARRFRQEVCDHGSQIVGRLFGRRCHCIWPGRMAFPVRRRPATIRPPSCPNSHLPLLGAVIVPRGLRTSRGGSPNKPNPCHRKSITVQGGQVDPLGEEGVSRAGTLVCLTADCRTWQSRRYGR